MKSLGSRADVRDGTLTRVKHEGTVYLLTKVGDDYYAMEDRCPHLGLSMARGEVSEGTIRCPWHGSRFDVCTGKNIDWVNGVVGIPLPKWSHKMIALGRSPEPIKSIKLVVDGENLRLP